MVRDTLRCCAVVVLTYGPVQIPNELTVALMTPPVNLGSKTKQKADDNHTTVLHFRVVQGCHKTRPPNPLLYLIYPCNNWILKPSQQARIFPVIPSALLYSTPKAPILLKNRSNELGNEVDTNTRERHIVMLPQTRTHPSINPQLPQLRLDKLRGAVPHNRKRLPRTPSLVESNPVHLHVKNPVLIRLPKCRRFWPS